MKRYLSLFLAAVLLMGCLSVTAFAAGSAVVSVSNAQAKAGQEVAVTFSVTDATFANYDLTITWDPAAMTLTEIRPGADYTGLFMGNPANGMVSYANSHDLTLTGTLFTAVFRVAENAPAGTYPVGLDVEYIADMTLEDLTVTVTAGSVTVGDVAAETVPPAPTEDMTFVPPEGMTEGEGASVPEATEPVQDTQPDETEAQPTQPGDAAQPDNAPADGDTAEGGGNTPLYIALGVMALALIVIAVILIIKRRKAE